MPLMKEFSNAFRTMRVYLMGRGLLSLGVIGASLAGAAFPTVTILSLAPALVLAIGGAALSGFMRLHAQAKYENNMVDLYRDDIAEQLGKAPEEVTRSDLKEAAKSNDIIDQALKRQSRRNTIGFVTTALAAIATFGLITTIAPAALSSWMITTFALDGVVAKTISFASTGFVAAVAGLVVQDGLEAVIGKGTGLSKAAAHDLIFSMQRDVARGKSVTPEQAYGVLVAGDFNLQAAIARQFRKPYNAMNTREQRNVLKQVGVVREMQVIAADINSGAIEPGHLAFIIGDAKHMNMTEATRDEEPVRSSHVEKLRLQERANGTFTERVSASRSGAEIAPAR
jgi:hypothetical protein